MCKRNLFIIFPKYFQLAIQIVFYQCNRSFIHLLSITVDQLDSVIIIRIMACRDHNTTVKPIGSCHISYRRCRRNMKQVSIRSRSYQTANQWIIHSYDYEINLFFFCKCYDLVKFHGSDRHALRHLGDSGIARRTVDLVDFFALGDLPCDRMLSSATSYDQYFHVSSPPQLLFRQLL